MSTVNLPSTGDLPPDLAIAPTSVRLLTAADVAALPDELPSGPVGYELESGKLIVMPPTGERHGTVQCEIGAHLKSQGEWQGLGIAYVETGVLLARNPDTLHGPDVSFVGNAKLPVRRTTEGYLETIPDLVVEVRSKNNTHAELDRKAQEYLAAGVLVVWIVDDASRTVKVLEANQPPRTFGEDDCLPTPAVIPNFTLTVKRIFGSATR